jgi:hypothetical protein
MKCLVDSLSGVSLKIKKLESCISIHGRPRVAKHAPLFDGCSTDSYVRAAILYYFSLGQCQTILQDCRFFC